MSQGITQSMINHIKENLPLLEVDINSGTILNRSHLNTGRYLTIKLKSRMVKVHHVVALVGGLPLVEGMVVNHIDGDRFNNSISNLEVIKHSENIKHAHDKGLIKRRNGEQLSWTKLSEGDVIKIKKRLLKGETCVSIANAFGVSMYTIHNIKKGRSWNHVTI